MIPRRPALAPAHHARCPRAAGAGVTRRGRLARAVGAWLARCSGVAGASVVRRERGGGAIAAKPLLGLNILNIRALLALVPLALAVTGCGPRPAAIRPPARVALDALLGFSDPARCHPTDRHARFLAALVVADGKGGFRAGRVDAPPALAAAFGPVTARHAEDYWVVGVAVTGTLFGLPLGRIDQALPDGGDAGDATYRFDVPVATAAQALRARGFPVKAGAAVPIDGGTGGGMEPVMSLLPDPADPAHSLFGCGYS